MFERTGRLDDMSTEVTACVRADCSGSIFPLVTADTHKSPAHDSAAAPVSHRPAVCFYSPSKTGVKICPSGHCID